MANEKRLIDANALLQEAHWVIRSDGTRVFVVHAEDIENAPTVDAVEVVWCKECMWAREKDHREPTETPRELICQCAKHHYIPAPWGARMAVRLDDFCSYGERREGE